MFSQAAGEVAVVKAATRYVDISSALRGGSLGRALAERLATCSALAASCIRELHNAASLCRSRAQTIGHYEAELSIYDGLMTQYAVRERRWMADRLRWANDDGPDPGSPPTPPPKPAAPPAWADVRRP